MRFTSVILASAALVGFAVAEDFKVQVGKDGLAFDPEQLDAKAGDTVTFIFHPKNHTVTQSTFKDPCTAMAGGFDSGFVGYTDAAPDKLKSYQITIEDEKPKWAYCAQVTPAVHCQKGMVFSINPNGGKKPDGSPTSADEYKKIALALASGPASSSASSDSASATGSASSGGSDSASATGSASASAASGSGSTSGSASAASGSGSATGSASVSAAVTSPSATGATSLAKPAASSTESASASNTSAAAASASASNAAGPLARNTAGALVAAAAVLSFVL